MSTPDEAHLLLLQAIERIEAALILVDDTSYQTSAFLIERALDQMRADAWPDAIDDGLPRIEGRGDTPRATSGSVRLAPIQMQREHAAFHSVVRDEPIARLAPQKRDARCYRATFVCFLQILGG
jgi:hypothetical protein